MHSAHSVPVVTCAALVVHKIINGSLLFCSPFAAAAGAAGGAPSPFGPYGAANPFSPSFTPPVDTTATPVTPTQAKPAPQAAAPASTAAADANGPRGEKFAARVGSPSSSTPAAEPKPAAAAAAPPPASNGSSAKANVDVVEPEVKEPTSSSSNSGPSAAAFFTDVGSDAGASSSGAASAQDPAQMTEMMDKMLRDPNMQKMLYPYLPEPMRNPESIEWMMNNPEVRKQMEDVFKQSVSCCKPRPLAANLLIKIHVELSWL